MKSAGLISSALVLVNKTSLASNICGGAGKISGAASWIDFCNNNAASSLVDTVVSEAFESITFSDGAALVVFLEVAFLVDEVEAEVLAEVFLVDEVVAEVLAEAFLVDEVEEEVLAEVFLADDAFVEVFATFEAGVVELVERVALSRQVLSWAEVVIFADMFFLASEEFNKSLKDCYTKHSVLLVVAFAVFRCERTS